MRTDLIQTSRLVLGRAIPLSASDSTLGKLPHRDTLLKRPSRTWRKDVKAQGLKKSLISIESMDEIPSGDRWSLTTVRSEGEIGVLSALTRNRC
jgi:hypothetical protein